MHSIIKSIIKFKNKINQTKKESNEQIIHSKHQFNYSINNNELQKNNKNNIKTTRKSLINRLHNRQSSNEKSINQYNNNNNNQLWNDQDDHLNVLDNHQQINDQLMTSLKLINNLPNYEDLDHDHNDDYQEYKQTIQQINSILSNSIIINPNYTEEELNKELEKLLTENFNNNKHLEEDDTEIFMEWIN
ncbi:unnamed protein product [Schistosoma margrebowiei]|uniref:Uncharacterized protein n=1 Tax=Schistosoma margrebowiei TaxID=48269 RepID=A0AA85AHA2_9TREM|nr:unnamed protein product [Schistosoma margrebowiei]